MKCFQGVFCWGTVNHNLPLLSCLSDSTQLVGPQTTSERPRSWGCTPQGLSRGIFIISGSLESLPDRVISSLSPLRNSGQLLYESACFGPAGCGGKGGKVFEMSPGNLEEQLDVSSSSQEEEPAHSWWESAGAAGRDREAFTYHREPRVSRRLETGGVSVQCLYISRNKSVRTQNGEDWGQKVQQWVMSLSVFAMSKAGGDNGKGKG